MQQWSFGKRSGESAGSHPSSALDCWCQYIKILGTLHIPRSIIRWALHLHSDALFWLSYNLDSETEQKLRPKPRGFQDWTNTRCANSFTVNTLWLHLPNTTLLNLWKRHYWIPRYIIQLILNDRLSNWLIVTIRPLLWSMKLRMKNYRSKKFVPTFLGVPEDDPPNPYLFNIFGHPHYKTKCQTTKRIYILFRGLMYSPINRMQTLVDDVLQWLIENIVKWTHIKVLWNQTFHSIEKGNLLSPLHWPRAMPLHLAGT